MSGIKVTYFNFNYLKGEVPKLALFLGGIDFEDVRIPRADWEAHHKHKYPFGQLPTLEANGKWLTQGMAMMLYAGKISGLWPKDAPWEEAKIVEVLMVIEEMLNSLRPALYGDVASRETLRKEALTTIFPLFCGRFEKILEENGNEYFVGDKLSIADLAVWSLENLFKMGIYEHVPSTVFDSYGKLAAHHQRVNSLPKIQEWKAKYADIYNPQNLKF